MFLSHQAILNQHHQVRCPRQPSRLQIRPCLRLRHRRLILCLRSNRYQNRPRCSKITLSKRRRSAELRESPRNQHYYRRDQGDQDNTELGSPNCTIWARCAACLFASQWSPAHCVDKEKIFHIGLLPHWTQSYERQESLPEKQIYLNY